MIGYVEKFMFEFIDGMAKAIEKTLSGASVEFVAANEWQTIKQKGISRGEEIIAKAKQKAKVNL